MKKIFLALSLFVAASATTSEAFAQTQSFTIDAANSHITVGPNPTLCAGSCKMTANLADDITDPLKNSFSLSIGQSTTLDFANVTVRSGIGFGTAAIDAVLAFSNPLGSAQTGGNALYARAGGFFTPGALAGSLQWTQPTQHLVAADGTAYTVSFGNVLGAQFGSSFVVPVSITLDGIATPAPEPATWALLILGFGVAGVALRRRRNTELNADWPARA